LQIRALACQVRDLVKNDKTGQSGRIALFLFKDLRLSTLDDREIYSSPKKCKICWKSKVLKLVTVYHFIKILKKHSIFS